jgi:hypothetical protein
MVGKLPIHGRPFNPVDSRLVSIARNTDELGRYSKDSAFQGGDGR